MLASGARCQIVGLLFLVCWVSACRDEYERMPKSSDADLQALTGRYKALLDEAKTVGEENPFVLLHHFTAASLSSLQLDDFKARVLKFAAEVKAGKYDKLEIRGARTPGRIRLLLIALPGGKGNIPYAQAADGWKIDDVEIAFGNFEKKIELHGAVPVFPPSVLSSLSVVQDNQASTKERVKEALRLTDSKYKSLVERLGQKESDPWTKASLLYAGWKAGGSACEGFAAAFPVEQELQRKLYDEDVESFRTLLVGLHDCALASREGEPVVRLYQGSSSADEGPRSEYVTVIVNIANEKPLQFLQASAKLGYKYEEDAAANIAVGAHHGEANSKFLKFVQEQSRQKARGKSKSALAAIANLFLTKMADRDQEEPPAADQ